MGKPWEQRKLGEVIDVRSGRDYKHLSEGNIPVYGTGGYMLSVNQALSYTEDAIGIGRKGTINNPYILKAPFWTVDTLFYCVPKKNTDLNFIFNIFQNIDWKKKDESTGVPSLSKMTINNVDFLIPSLKEQSLIGNFFVTLDNLITLHQHQLDLLKEQKKGLLQKMFPKDGSNVPEIRFLEFTTPWEQHKLGNLGEIEIKLVNPNEHPNKPFIEYSMPAFDDNRKPLERLGNEFQLSRVAIMNSVLLINKLNVRKRRIWKVSEPSKNSICTGEFLPFYPNKKIEFEFLNQQLISDRITNNLVQFSAGSSNSQKRITPQALLDLDISVPSLEEQYKIGQLFLSLDNLITLHQRELDLLKEQKKGLLQKMFPKEGEDTPKVRFPEFR